MPLAQLSGLRYDVGTDYFHTYRPVFDAIGAGAGPGETPVEIGFWLLVKGIQLLGGSHVWMFLASSFVIAGFFAAGIYRLSALPWYSMLLFLLAELYFISMNAMRQYMGLAIVFFGFAYLGADGKKPCLWKWALCVVASALFHTSNLLFLPLFFLMYLKVNPFVALSLSAFNAPLSGLAKWLLSFTPYKNYWGSEFHSEVPFYDARMMINLFVLLLALNNWNKDSREENATYRFFYYCTLFAVFWG